MFVASGPVTIFKIILYIVSLILNLAAFRCHPCSCGKRRCTILPLFLSGNILALLLYIPDLVLAFGQHSQEAKTTCAFNFVASNLLCTFFVALGVLRRVVTIPGLMAYQPFFFASLVFTPLLAGAIQAFYAKTAQDEPLVLQLSVPVASYAGPHVKEVVIPLVTCAKSICGSSDVVLAVMSTVVPSLIPIVSFVICFLISYSIRKKLRLSRNKSGSDDLALSMIPEQQCDREQHCWQVLKFVLLLFFGWTVLAKPFTLVLTHLTRLYNQDRLGETSVYVCSNFWDIGNNIILFISASVTPFFFVTAHERRSCGREDFSDKKSLTSTYIDRPVTVMGDVDCGTFTWDTFTFLPAGHKEQISGSNNWNKSIA